MDLRLKNVRISFANGLWNKSAAAAGGTPKFGCDYIVGPDSVVERKTSEGKWVPTTLQEAEQMTATAYFKGNATKATEWLADLDTRQKAVRNGNKNKNKNTGEVRDGYAGTWYVAAKSKDRMPVYRSDMSEVKEESESPVYSGCYVNARVQLYVNAKPGQQGLFAGLQGTQFLKDGDSFGGGHAASTDDFEAVQGAGAEDFA